MLRIDADLLVECYDKEPGGTHIKPENLFLLKNDSANAGNLLFAIERIMHK